ncbi:GNAT family N-acetyltransferase [Pantoea agglomerans]|uniref:GNAT family N-acetyltransferase n=1 Tax=Enterobacter agglomerans TaxID=549 RepID=UPI0032089B9C
MTLIKSGEISSPLSSQTHDYSIHIAANVHFLDEVVKGWGIKSFEELKTLKKQCPNRQVYEQKLVSKNLHDYFWDWEEIIEKPSNYTKETFYLIAKLNNTNVQGVLHAYFPEQSRISKGSQIVYIDRLAVAPWNRQEKGNKKYFKGVGSLLLLAIKEYSHSKGMDGCIGLHSLPAAEPFYRKFNMTDMGQDASHENLRYFEI